MWERDFMYVLEREKEWEGEGDRERERDWKRGEKRVERAINRERMRGITRFRFDNLHGYFGFQISKWKL